MTKRKKKSVVEKDYRLLTQSFLKDKKGFTKYHIDTAKMFFSYLRDSKAVFDTLFLQYLIDRDNYHQTEDGWFFCEVKKAGEYLFLSDYQQRETVVRLEKLKIIQTEKRGVPPRRYFKIDYNRYLLLISNYLTFESQTITDIIIRLDSLDSTISKDIALSESDDSANTNFIRKPKEKKKEFPTNVLIEYWNSIEWTRTHKDPNSKTYRKAVKYFRELKQGKFTKEFDSKWKEDHLKLLNRKWTDDQLKEAIDNVSLYLKDGYWPEDKDDFPKDLPTLIYNSYSQKKKSLLITAYKKKPELLSESSKAPKEKNKKVTNMFIRILRDFYNEFGDDVDAAEEELSQEELATVIRGANDVIDYSDWLIEKLERKNSHLLSEFTGGKHPCKLAKFYIQYLQEERYPNYGIEPHMVGPKSPANNWYGFTGWLGEVLLDGTTESGHKFFRR